jgi:hypothetical protein
MVQAIFDWPNPSNAKGRKVLWTLMPMMADTPVTIPIHFSLVAVDSAHHEYGRSSIAWRNPK